MVGDFRASLNVIVLTYNEEKNLLACLKSVAPVASKTFVVDSGSSDATLEIAREIGSQVFSHGFVSHSQQWRWALSSLPLDCDWVLALDADQVLSPELAVSIRSFLHQAPADVKGAYVCRRQVFRGTWIRHGGYYPKYLLKLFLRTAVSIPDDLVDHHFVVPGRTVRLDGDLIESNRNEDNITTWVDKHNRYAERQALEDFQSSDGVVSLRSAFGSPDARVRLLKSIWRRLPLYVRPVVYFIYRYILRGGFLDGKQGFIFHVLQGFWYRLLVDIKIDELRALAARTTADRNNH